MKWAMILIVVLNFSPLISAQPYQAMGLKTGEVTADSAIVWTRLTKNPERIPATQPMPSVLYKDPGTGELTDIGIKNKKEWESVISYPAGSNINTIEGAVPGVSGEIRLQYSADGLKWGKTEWVKVTEETDFIHQFRLSNLKPDTSYKLKSESRSCEGSAGQTVTGKFVTTPLENTPQNIRFAVSTGQRYDRKDSDEGFQIYDVIQKLNPHFFIHTGDILYYDQFAKNEALARWHWQRTYSLPTNVRFHNNVGSYFIKDDHDTWRNDCWPSMEGKYMGDFTFKQGQAIFREQVPMGKKTYRTVRWGKDLQIWLVEGRDFRSSNKMKDGPEKTIWGKEQMDWFRDTVESSDATFRLLISPTPVVGPDRPTKGDNHANITFRYEGNLIRNFIAEQNNMFVICGDRHWQYVSLDKKTGVREYSCGPATDKHAGGWSNDMKLPEHQYLNVTGGFLSVEVKRSENKPSIYFKHHAVDGKILNEEVFQAQKK